VLLRDIAYLYERKEVNSCKPWPCQRGKATMLYPDPQSALNAYLAEINRCFDACKPHFGGFEFWITGSPHSAKKY